MFFSPIDKGSARQAPDALLPRRTRRRRIAILLLPLAGVLFLGVKQLSVGDEAQASAPPPMVTVSRPLERTIVEWDDYVGRFEASQAVEIRARVSGALQSIHFKDGDIVRKGQLLFVIDPRPFTAALAEAKAREASAEAALALARSDYERASRLIDDQAVSQEEMDQLRAAVRSAEAGLAAARAQVRARALDVEFTQVRAPITGRVSDRRVDVGNLVGNGSGNSVTLLTTVYALDPLYFSFDGSEALYLKQLRQNGGPTKARVEIKLQDESEYRWKGHVDFTDNAIDASSGTMRARAVVANPDYFLVPGMFGNMRLAAGPARKALLVPDAAIVTDQARKLVYVASPSGAAEARPVTLGPRIGSLRVVRAGLTSDDRVVVSGIQFAQSGAKLATREEPIRTDATKVVERADAVPAASQATFVDS